jgi:hypothetical protein
MRFTKYSHSAAAAFHVPGDRLSARGKRSGYLISRSAKVDPMRGRKTSNKKRFSLEFQKWWESHGALCKRSFSNRVISSRNRCSCESARKAGTKAHRKRMSPIDNADSQSGSAATESQSIILHLFLDWSPRGLKLPDLIFSGNHDIGG